MTKAKKTSIGNAKNRCKPENYGPISLLPTLGKIIEKAILTRLKNHFNLNNLIPVEQFGFTEKHSIDQQLLRLVENTNHNMNNNRLTATAALDVENDFERVSHSALLEKIENTNHLSLLSPHLHNIFTADIPKPRNADIALFADDTAIITTAKHKHDLVNKLQKAFDKVEYKYQMQIRLR